MKIILGIVLIYILLVVASSALFKYIITEETWSKIIKNFTIGYFIVGIVISMFIVIIHYCFN